MNNLIKSTIIFFALLSSSVAYAETVNNAHEMSFDTMLLQVLFGLLVVVLVIMAGAFAVKKFNPLRFHTTHNMRIVSSLSLGGKERIVLINVCDQLVLVGASPGHISTLKELGSDEPIKKMQTSNKFMKQLKKSLDKEA